ncbi:MAG: phosphoribosyl-ATP diphosphatase [Myxococcota bacterium]
MLIPSIDLLDGQTVQLIGGEEKALDAGPPAPIAERFGVVGEVAVIDLSAALGRGSNRALIDGLLSTTRCRVGGGIRDLETAIGWLDRGAEKVILGTRAVPEILRELPKERVIAAVDAFSGEVVVEGWKTRTGERTEDRVAALAPYVGGFLITFVEREGRLGGSALDQMPALVRAAGAARVTFAGGVTTADEVRAIDALGADAQVGMALYTGRLGLGEAAIAPLLGSGPWPTVLTDEDGTALAVAMLDRAALIRLIEDRGLGGANVLRVDLETAGGARQAVRVMLRGPNLPRSFGPAAGLPALMETLRARRQEAPPGSYARRLFDDPPLLAAKLEEEAKELAEATDRAHVIAEAADVAFMSSVALARAGADWTDVARALDRRAKKISRRGGDAKPKKEP